MTTVPYLKLGRILPLLAALLIAFKMPHPADAVILFATDDPTADTSPPTGLLADSGWQYEGIWGGFLGTAIAPDFFISAAHIGQQSTVFVLDGTNYTIVRSWSDPESDLIIWQVAEPMPRHAPLYAKHDEVGRNLVAIGRGTQRGGDVTVDDNLRGWYWGPGDGVERWGENVVTAIVNFGSTRDDFLGAAFDANGLPNECHLSGGDSGGALFLNDDGIWKLAGIHYSVDGPFYTDGQGNGEFDGALFDARDFYIFDGAQYVRITGGDSVPSRFYSTRISSKLPWIESVIDPSGDLDGDGLTNLLEYALNLDPLVSDRAGAPQFSLESKSAALTYTKIVAATDLSYIVEESADLMTWNEAPTRDEILYDDGVTQIVRANVNLGGAPLLFLRLRIARP